jgi:hypothetical protein
MHANYYGLNPSFLLYITCFAFILYTLLASVFNIVQLQVVCADEVVAN